MAGADVPSEGGRSVTELPEEAIRDLERWAAESASCLLKVLRKLEKTPFKYYRMSRESSFLISMYQVYEKLEVNYRELQGLSVDVVNNPPKLLQDRIDIDEIVSKIGADEE